MAGKGQDSNPVSEGTVETLGAYQRFKRELLNMAEAGESFGDSAEEISARVADKMLSADTLEEAIAAQDAGLPNGQDLVDIEHTVISFDAVKSAKAPHGAYLRVYATALEPIPALGVGTGEEFTYQVGAANVVPILWKASKAGRLPLAFVFRDKEMDSGGRLLYARLVPRRAI
jgi:hypothetical protein